MPVSVQCECGRNLKARDEFAGKRAECPTCGRTLTIPQSPGAQPGQAADAAGAIGERSPGVLNVLCPCCFRQSPRDPAIALGQASRCPHCGETAVMDPAGASNRPPPQARQPEAAVRSAPRRTDDAAPLEIREFLDPPSAPAAPKPPRKKISLRMMFEALLDPRSIQWMLTLGGGLLVLGVVIWLVSAGMFDEAWEQAVAMGAGTLGMIAAGWWLVLKRRFRTAGQALTFLGCVVAPLNLWFYDAQGLVLVDGNLWIWGVVCCLIYAATVYTLRDPLFMYAVEGGITLTLLLLLANLQLAGDTAFLCIVLTVIGLVSIHAERSFDPGEEGTFTRRRFGMPLFWSGHAQLAGALLLLAGTQAWGWMGHRHLFGIARTENLLLESPIWAGALWLAGTYAYLYSDLVVRRVGVYTYIAAGCLLMAEATLAWNQLGAEGVIAILALTALAANLVLNSVKETNEKLNRAIPPLALGLSALPVVLGLAMHLRATSELARHLQLGHDSGGLFVVVMVLVALCNRASAFLFRHKEPRTSAVYFFFSAGSLIVAAAGLLRQSGLVDWTQQAPLLMLIPLAYLVAARLWMGHTPERPLVLIAHAATAVILFHGLVATVDLLGQVIQPRQGHIDNLLLGLVFSEAAVFYTLAGIFRKRSVNVYFASAAACGALWQFMGYWGQIPQAYYTMLYAVLGIAALVAGRALGLEQVERYDASGEKNLATRGRGLALFQSGNAILFVALLAAFLQGLSHLATREREVLSSTLFALVLTTVANFAAIAVVPAGNWRRLYWTSSIALSGLCLLIINLLSHFTPWQKLEILCVLIGAMLIVTGYIGRFREGAADLGDGITLGLWLGSVLVTAPLLIAWCTWGFDHVPEEMAIVVFTILMLATGFPWQVKSTTLAGGGTLFAYLVVKIVQLAYHPQLGAGIYLTVGGGLVFLAGLVLSIYRDRLMLLPDRIAKREGLFRIIDWR